MYRDIAKLIMYGDIDEDCILYQMGEIFREFEEGTQSNAVLIRKVYTQIKRLLTGMIPGESSFQTSCISMFKNNQL